MVILEARVHARRLLNGFDPSLQMKSTFVRSRWVLPASYHCIMVLGAYRVYGITFLPPGRMVHAAQSIKPALTSVNDGLSIITFKYWLSQSVVRMSLLVLRKLVLLLHIPAKHHPTCFFTMGLTILHVACIMCIMGKAYISWGEDRALSG